GDVDAGDDDRLDRAIPVIRGDARDVVDDLAGLVIGDLAEDGVVAVEVRGRHDGDEELGTVGAAAAALAGVGHGQQVRAIELELRVDLVVEVVARAASAGTQRVAALDHEAGDDAVEHGLVVERAGLGAGRVLPGVLL